MADVFKVGKCYQMKPDQPLLEDMAGLVWVVTALDTRSPVAARGLVLTSTHTWMTAAGTWSSSTPSRYDELSDDEATLYKLGKE